MTRLKIIHRVPYRIDDEGIIGRWWYYKCKPIHCIYGRSHFWWIFGRSNISNTLTLHKKLGLNIIRDHLSGSIFWMSSRGPTTLRIRNSKLKYRSPFPLVHSLIGAMRINRRKFIVSSLVYVSYVEGGKKMVLTFCTDSLVPAIYISRFAARSLLRRLRTLFG